MTRAIFFLMVGLLARADPIDDAVRDLSKRIAARLGPAETVHLTSRNLSSLPAAEASRLENVMEIALRKRVHNPTIIDVTLTISENIRGFILIAELQRPGDAAVEIVEFRRSPAAATEMPTLNKQLLWTQDKQVLDVATAETRMFVLDAAGITVYDSAGGKWERVDGNVIDFPPVRDQRGRLELEGESIRADLPSRMCRGAWKPALALACNAESWFTPARNTLDMKDWRGVFYQSIQLGSAFLVAELDGRVHVYDGNHMPQGTFEGWGDFAPLTSQCGEYVVASSTAPAGSDTIALYQLSNHSPVRVTEPVEMAGLVSALWPAGSKVVAIVFDSRNQKYAAYALTTNCSP